MWPSGSEESREPVHRAAFVVEVKRTHERKMTQAPSLRGFARRDIDARGVRIRLAIGGSGAPLLLLHGHPQTHAIWHRVAATLAQGHTVVAADLRGYGDSSRPEGAPDHANYAKRVMARDQLALMPSLCVPPFDVLAP